MSKYESVSDYDGGLAIVSNEGLLGLINQDGKVVQKAVCDTIYRALNQCFIIGRNKKYGALDSLGRIFLPAEYDSIGLAFSKQYIPVMKNGRWAVVSVSGEILTSFVYDDLRTSSDCYVASKGDKYGLVDYNGNVLIDFKYDSIVPHYFSSYEKEEGAGVAILNDKYAILNEANQEVTKCVYDKVAWDVCDNLLVVKRGQYGNQKAGAIDVRDGRIVIPLEYEDLGAYKDGLFSAELNGKCGYIDVDNNVVVPFIYDEAYDFSEGLAMVVKFYDRPGYYVSGKHCGFIDRDGDVVIPIRHDSPSFIFPKEFSEGLCAMGKDKTGKGISPSFYGFIGTDGHFVIDPIYEDVCQFKGGVSFVKSSGRWGAINRRGELIIPCSYDEYGHVYDHCISFIGPDGKVQYFDKEGNAIRRPKIL